MSSPFTRVCKQHVHCSGNVIASLTPLRHLPLLLSVDARNNQLTDVLGALSPSSSPLDSRRSIMCSCTDDRRL